MEVILIKEEEHGLIGVATTVKAAKQWLIQEGWVTRDSIFWDFELEEGSSLGELHGDNWENAYEHLNEEDMDCLGIYLCHEKLIEEDNAVKNADRRHLMNLALRGNKVYQHYQKQFDYMVKKAISSLITLILLDEEDRSWSKDYKKVVEGL